MRKFKVVLESETGEFKIKTIKRKTFLGKRITENGVIYLLNQNSRTTFPVYKQAFLTKVVK